MKIAVASNNQQTVARHVGRCRGFLIYEVDEEKVINKNYIENTFTHHRMQTLEEHNHEEVHYGHHHGEGHGHGHGGHSHQALADALQGCAALIFKSGGWRLIEDLQANNIIPILTDEKFADEAVQKYLKGELETKEDNTCHH